MRLAARILFFSPILTFKGERCGVPMLSSHRHCPPMPFLYFSMCDIIALPARRTAGEGKKKRVYNVRRLAESAKTDEREMAESETHRRRERFQFVLCALESSGKSEPDGKAMIGMANKAYFWAIGNAISARNQTHC